ncbi:Hpt domain-containing protein [Vibrio coralliilyticus]|uniref:Hpt domain-containing protein n=1 Tax=Vibrio coralliilyticus TaxID=190893 RepID=UPI00155FCFEF|nr:Hpt domain-containing protein [Vibrio coralliilyticus]NRF31193.1 Hpt domain-containing protein [Vibrio coralliilyticus]NRF53004.1 Hpt domain-containing protein [Vibrio coralliilyticus]NRG03568.1 Hpt domain-containing protein [Vibrio coralliilyticus]
MERKALKLSWLIIVVWVIGTTVLSLSYRSNVMTMSQVGELSNSIDELKYSLFQEPAYRAELTDGQSLNLQLIYALRLQIEATYEQSWLTPDINQLLYTTDRFIEQTKVFLDNELALISLVDQVRFIRAKYQDNNELMSNSYHLSANVLEALFSSNRSNPQVFRELDQLYVASESLPALQKQDLQQLLSQTSAVLGSYAQGSYVIEKMMTHSIHTQINVVESQYQSQQRNLVIGGVIFSGICLIAMMLITYRFTGVQRMVERSEKVADNSQKEVQSIVETAKESAPMVTAAAALDDGPEIDLDGMLDSLGNDYESVCMLLQVFVDDHTGDAERITQLLNDSPEEALRKAHSLKGVGGNLGALKLRESAGKVEQAIKDDIGSVSGLLDELKARLDKAILEAQTFLNEQDANG